MATVIACASDRVSRKGWNIGLRALWLDLRMMLEQAFDAMLKAYTA